MGLTILTDRDIKPKVGSFFQNSNSIIIEFKFSEDVKPGSPVTLFKDSGEMKVKKVVADYEVLGIAILSDTSDPNGVIKSGEFGNVLVQGSVVVDGSGIVDGDIGKVAKVKAGEDIIKTGGTISIGGSIILDKKDSFAQLLLK